LNKQDENFSWFSKLKQVLGITAHNEDELLQQLRDAQNHAVITPETLTILEGAIVFSQMRARDIMLPKSQMVCIKKEETFYNILDIVTQSGHSRFPVLDNDSDEIIGILHAKDLLAFAEEKPDAFELIDICRQAPFVPEGKRLDSLLSEFRRNKNHMAIVVDEYGAVTGFITIEDIIEQIVGDIEDEFDIEEEPYIKSHANAQYIIRAHMPIEEFNEQLNTDFSDETYDTIGGIVMNHFGHLPLRGEIVTIKGLEFKVINADARRIKLLECIDNRARDAELFKEEG
jgi:magnesium and cobalt transporter